EADGLRLGVLVADIACELLLFLFEAFDLLDELPQLVLRRGLKRTHGSSLLNSNFAQRYRRGAGAARRRSQLSIGICWKNDLTSPMSQTDSQSCVGTFASITNATDLV